MQNAECKMQKNFNFAFCILHFAFIQCADAKACDVRLRARLGDGSRETLRCGSGSEERSFAPAALAELVTNLHAARLIDGRGGENFEFRMKN
jgi:hypothetical protein